MKVCVISDFNAVRGALIDFMIWYGSKRSYMKHMLHMMCKSISYSAVRTTFKVLVPCGQKGMIIPGFFCDNFLYFSSLALSSYWKGQGLNTLRSMKNVTLMELQTKVFQTLPGSPWRIWAEYSTPNLQKWHRQSLDMERNWLVEGRPRQFKKILPDGLDCLAYLSSCIW